MMANNVLILNHLLLICDDAWSLEEKKRYFYLDPSKGCPLQVYYQNKMGKCFLRDNRTKEFVVEEAI